MMGNKYRVESEADADKVSDVDKVDESSPTRLQRRLLAQHGWEERYAARWISQCQGYSPDSYLFGRSLKERLGGHVREGSTVQNGRIVQCLILGGD